MNSNRKPWRLDTGAQARPKIATFDGLSSGGAVINANLMFFRVFAYLLLLQLRCALITALYLRLVVGAIFQCTCAPVSNLHTENHTFLTISINSRNGSDTMRYKDVKKFSFCTFSTVIMFP